MTDASAPSPLVPSSRRAHDGAYRAGRRGPAQSEPKGLSRLITWSAMSLSPPRAACGGYDGCGLVLAGSPETRSPSPPSPPPVADSARCTCDMPLPSFGLLATARGQSACSEARRRRGVTRCVSSSDAGAIGRASDTTRAPCRGSADLPSGRFSTPRSRCVPYTIMPATPGRPRRDGRPGRHDRHHHYAAWVVEPRLGGPIASGAGAEQRVSGAGIQGQCGARPGRSPSPE